jgi:hypothetical protein
MIWAIAANAERDGGFSEISTSQGLPQNFTLTPDFRVAGVAEIFVQTAQVLFIIFHRSSFLVFFAKPSCGRPTCLKHFKKV